MSVGIAYVDGPRLARSVFAAADWVTAGRDEINRINVFPVPDGDTGTNFSLTLRAVADALARAGHQVDRRRIELDHPIKSLGEHLVSVRLHPEV
ncbi:MAG TPA: 50S ribosomal L9 C-terminal domain-containing protein, partial [Gemmatimonadales bacterium]|nr:50S ribosomal L9 C-terminal domain-containing protein [Gemmatimonadales bacterium]